MPFRNYSFTFGWKKKVFIPVFGIMNNISYEIYDLFACKTRSAQIWCRIKFDSETESVIDEGWSINQRHSQSMNGWLNHFFFFARTIFKSFCLHLFLILDFVLLQLVSIFLIRKSAALYIICMYHIKSRFSFDSPTSKSNPRHCILCLERTKIHMGQQDDKTAIIFQTSVIYRSIIVCKFTYDL